jgi:hypothetical protein
MVQVTHQYHVEPLAVILFGGGDFVNSWFGHADFRIRRRVGRLKDGRY